MNYIWVFMIIVSYIFSFFAKTTEAVTKSVFDGCSDAVTLVISLLGMMCLWTGLLEIAERSGLVKKVQKLLSPVISWLFPTIDKKTEVAGAISMSITANLLGLSNAATPLGLSVMEKLEKRNLIKETASDEMCMFVVINTASVTLLPTTLLTLRTSYMSGAPFEVIVPIWIVSLVSLLSGIICAKLCQRRKRA
ncbi:MAG: hypothetical protein IJB50_04060 [Clostridia bacterium]|nr:hypothetical protein [Clostridia bacterium]